jgi:hypothetical protein
MIRLVKQQQLLLLRDLMFYVPGPAQGCAGVHAEVLPNCVLCHAMLWLCRGPTADV